MNNYALLQKCLVELENKGDLIFNMSNFLPVFNSYTPNLVICYNKKIKKYLCVSSYLIYDIRGLSVKFVDNLCNFVI
jgi:hypothetical protein